MDTCAGVNPSRVEAVFEILLPTNGGELRYELRFDDGELTGDGGESSALPEDRCWEANRGEYDRE